MPRDSCECPLIPNGTLGRGTADTSEPLHGIRLKDMTKSNNPSKLPLREIPLCEMPLREMPLSEMPFREMPLYEMSFCEMPLREMSLRMMALRDMPLHEMRLKIMKVDTSIYQSMMKFSTSNGYVVCEIENGPRASIIAVEVSRNFDFDLDPRNPLRMEKTCINKDSISFTADAKGPIKVLKIGLQSIPLWNSRMMILYEKRMRPPRMNTLIEVDEPRTEDATSKDKHPCQDTPLKEDMTSKDENLIEEDAPHTKDSPSKNVTFIEENATSIKGEIIDLDFYCKKILKNGPFTPMVRVEESTDGDMVIPVHYAPKDPYEYTEPEKKKKISAIREWRDLRIITLEVLYGILKTYELEMIQRKSLRAGQGHVVDGSSALIVNESQTSNDDPRSQTPVASASEQRNNDSQEQVILELEEDEFYTLDELDELD
ncbi:hypothetical protein AgCh_016263 [Apium graveolens]